MHRKQKWFNPDRLRATCHGAIPSYPSDNTEWVGPFTILEAFQNDSIAVDLRNFPVSLLLHFLPNIINYAVVSHFQEIYFINGKGSGSDELLGILRSYCNNFQNNIKNCLPIKENPGISVIKVPSQFVPFISIQSPRNDWTWPNENRLSQASVLPPSPYDETSYACPFLPIFNDSLAVDLHKVTKQGLYLILPNIINFAVSIGSYEIHFISGKGSTIRPHLMNFCSINGIEHIFNPSNEGIVVIKVPTFFLDINPS